MVRVIVNESFAAGNYVKLNAATSTSSTLQLSIMNHLSNLQVRGDYEARSGDDSETSSESFQSCEDFQSPDMADITKKSNNAKSAVDDLIHRKSDNKKPDIKSGVSENPMGKKRKGTPAKQMWVCPLCTRPQKGNDKDLNTHIDCCLNQSAIHEAAADKKELPFSDISFEKAAESEDRRGSVNGVAVKKSSNHISIMIRCPRKIENMRLPQHQVVKLKVFLPTHPNNTVRSIMKYIRGQVGLDLSDQRLYLRPQNGSKLDL